MSFVAGILWSLGGAVAHSAIDLLRKLGAQRLQPVGKIFQCLLWKEMINTEPRC
jgi:glucose uptake protein GlcU